MWKKIAKTWKNIALAWKAIAKKAMRHQKPEPLMPFDLNADSGLQVDGGPKLSPNAVRARVMNQLQSDGKTDPLIQKILSARKVIS